MSNLISWDHQRAFLAVLEEGSLSAAARRLGVSQPTVRGWIAALENALNTTLFTRSVSGLTPTENARALVESARAMALASEVFLRTATASPGEIAGAVRLSVSETMGIEVIPSMLAALKVKHPRITIELAVTNKSADLLGQEVDIAVRNFSPQQDALVAKKVGAVPVGFFASTDYLDRRGWPQTMDDLAEHDIIGPDRHPNDRQLGSATMPGLSAACYVLRTDSHPARIAAARAGLGITVAQVPIGTRDSRLRRVLPEATVMTLDVWIATHEDLRNVAKIRAVFDHLVSTFTDFLGSDDK
ncbi:MAG: LysR family transcriptional regulator [Rhodanobacter sp.]